MMRRETVRSPLLIESINSPLIITSRDRRSFPQRPVVTLEVNILLPKEQLELWDHATGSTSRRAKWICRKTRLTILTSALLQFKQPACKQWAARQKKIDPIASGAFVVFRHVLNLTTLLSASIRGKAGMIWCYPTRKSRFCASGGACAAAIEGL